MATKWNYKTLYDPAPQWMAGTKDEVKLWHGCTQDDADNIWISGIDLTKCREDTDFGRGFYLTHIERQANHWAWLRHYDLPLAKRYIRPVTMQFTINRARLAELHSLSFVSGSSSNVGYWSLVQYCRQSPKYPRHFTHQYTRSSSPLHGQSNNGWYDTVHGPVSAFWYQRIATYDEDQISFHTDRAVQVLKDFVDARKQNNNDRGLDQTSDLTGSIAGE